MIIFVNLSSYIEYLYSYIVILVRHGYIAKTLIEFDFLCFVWETIKCGFDLRIISTDPTKPREYIELAEKPNLGFCKLEKIGLEPPKLILAIKILLQRIFNYYVF